MQMLILTFSLCIKLIKIISEYAKTTSWIYFKIKKESILNQKLQKGLLVAGYNKAVYNYNGLTSF